MIFTDELELNRLYKRRFFLPIDEKNKKKGSAVFILSPNPTSSLNVLANPLMDRRYYTSYFLEKDITYYINHEGYITQGEYIEEHARSAESDREDSDDSGINENKKNKKSNITSDVDEHARSAESDREDEDDSGINEFVGRNLSKDEYQIDESFIRCSIDNQDIVFGFNSGIESVINEASANKSQLHKMLYNERFKTPKEVLDIYDSVKEQFPDIHNYHLSYDKYKGLNLFIDLGFYNQTFFKNNVYKANRAADIYFDFLNRFFHDIRLEPFYNKKTVIIPINEWIDINNEDVNQFNFKKDTNPISIIMRMVKFNPVLLQDWTGIDFILLTNTGYMRINPSSMIPSDIIKIQKQITKLLNNDPILDDDNEDSKKAIVANIADSLEKSQKIKMNNLTGDSGEFDKDELVRKIDKAAASSNTTDEAIDNMEGDEHLKRIISNLSEEDDDVQINATRRARLSKVQNDFMEKKVNNTSIKDMITKSHTDVDLPETKLDIDTIDESWEHLKFKNFEKVYDPNDDIVSMLNSFANKKNPIVVRDLKIEDTSTSEDFIQTYIVQMEDGQGQRFTIKFDVPKFKDNRYMWLRGNEKTINGQLVLLPVSKTAEGVVQVVSNYNKIFIERYGTTTGKSYEIADRIIKAINKYEGNKIKVIDGDNRRICSKYELPIDYIDIGSAFNKIELKDSTIYFNQDEIRDKYKGKIDDKKGIPIGDNKDGDILYFNESAFGTFSDMLKNMLNIAEPGFNDLYNSTNASVRYTYSRASILDANIPLIVVMAYSEGLNKVLSKTNIEYEFVEKRPPRDTCYIKFKDGFLMYRNSYEASLLLNGLKHCNTEDYSVLDVDKKEMYLDFLDLFGGRIKADGLDNFYDLMIDDITLDVLKRYKLPEDYISLLIYANQLLADNKYIKHVDMSSNRYRTNELIAGYTYKALASAYGQYRTNLKRGKKVPMAIKKTAVIDAVLLDPTCADASKINDILDCENMNSVGYKGLAGMNSDRSYGLDKRTYDKSMLNLLAMSTGFAGNVGLTRQTTIDMNIEGKRGYLKIAKNSDDMSATKSLCITEAMTPYGSTRDDPFRTAMTFIQTAKHGMRIKNGTPQLITNGADQALPYLSSNTFSFKSKGNGKVVEKTNEYLIVKYDNGTSDFVDLRENIQKNSSSGFYIGIKLDTDLKEGSKVKPNQILAYDKLSYSDTIGNTGNIAYNLGALAKIAILNNDEGYEDSAIISEYLSDAMSSEVVLKKDVVLPKNTNVYNIVKKGQSIKEGEPLMIFQNAFDEDDVNILLKNLVDDEEAISDLGRIPIKSKVEGTVTDIKIYRTVEKDELSDSLKKVVNELEKPIGEMKKIMKKNGVEYFNQVEPDYKLEPTGKLKNAKDSVLIEFYLKYEDKMSVGDKLVYYSALKGVVKEIFPKGKEPYSEYRKDEKLQSLLPIGSVNGRMVTSILINGGINKVLIELDRAVKTMAGIPFKYLDAM